MKLAVESKPPNTWFSNGEMPASACTKPPKAISPSVSPLPVRMSIWSTNT
jgi:hypothetical protein